MILAEKTAQLRELERYAARTGYGGQSRSDIARFVSSLAVSLDETERQIHRVAGMRLVRVNLTDIADSPVVVSGTWSNRVANLNGMGDVPAFLSELSVAADRVRVAIVELGGRDVVPRLGKFAAICQENLDAGTPYRFLAEFADGLDALTEAADELPERAPEATLATAGPKRSGANSPATRGRRPEA